MWEVSEISGLNVVFYECILMILVKREGVEPAHLRAKTIQFKMLE